MMLLKQRTLLKVMIYYMVVLIFSCVYLINRDYQFVHLMSLDDVIKIHFQIHGNRNEPLNEVNSLRTSKKIRNDSDNWNLTNLQDYLQDYQRSQNTGNNGQQIDNQQIQSEQSQQQPTPIQYVEYRQIRNQPHYIEPTDGLIYEFKQAVHQIEDWMEQKYARLKKTEFSLVSLLTNSNKPTGQSNRLKVDKDKDKNQNDVCKQSNVQTNYIGMGEGYIQITTIQPKKSYRLKQNQTRQNQQTSRSSFLQLGNK